MTKADCMPKLVACQVLTPKLIVLRVPRTIEASPIKANQ